MLRLQYITEDRRHFDDAKRDIWITYLLYLVALKVRKMLKHMTCCQHSRQLLVLANR
ncbi:hypothetical protein Hanom_Chr11g00993411 [Helianthus anomalus]